MMPEAVKTLACVVVAATPSIVSDRGKAYWRRLRRERIGVPVDRLVKEGA